MLTLPGQEPQSSGQENSSSALSDFMTGYTPDQNTSIIRPVETPQSTVQQAAQNEPFQLRMAKQQAAESADKKLSALDLLQMASGKSPLNEIDQRTHAKAEERRADKTGANEPFQLRMAKMDAAGELPKQQTRPLTPAEQMEANRQRLRADNLAQMTHGAEGKNTTRNGEWVRDNAEAARAIDRIFGVDRTQVTGGKTNWGKLILGNYVKGMYQWANNFWKTANMVLDEPAQGIHDFGTTAINSVIETLNDIPGVNIKELEYGDNFVRQLYNISNAEVAAQRDYFAANANTSRAAQLIDRFGTETVAAVPFALEALFVAGAKAPQLIGNTTKDLRYLSSINGGKGIEVVGAELREGIEGLARNPQFWSSYLQTAGGSYEEALQDGMDEGQAAIYALTNGAMNAAIEVGGIDEALGGIQNMTNRKNGGNILREALLAGGQELGEEIEQGITGRGLKAMSGQDVPLVSFDKNDTRAIINPWTAAEEGIGGFVVGSLLGGGQTAISNIGTRAASTATQAAVSPAVQETAQQAAPAVAENPAQAAEIERETSGDIPAPPAPQNADTGESERLNRAHVAEESAPEMTTAESVMSALYDLVPQLRPSAVQDDMSTPKAGADFLEEITGMKAQRAETTSGAIESLLSMVERPGQKNYFGEELYVKLKKAGEGLSKSAATNPGGIANSFRSWVNGQKTADGLKRDYDALKRQDGGYYFDQSVADRLEDLAEATRDGKHLDSSGQVKPEYRRMIEQMATQLEHRTLRQAEMLEQRKTLEKEVRAATPAIKRGVKGAISKAAERYRRVQYRPDTMFYSLAGFDRRNGKALYDLGEKSRRVVADKINIHQTAESFFSDIAQADGYKDFARGKSTMPNIVPGLDTGTKEISTNYALGLLKLLETEGAIDHIVENGAQFAYSEKELYKGQNNNGFGDVKGYAQDIPLISEQARENLMRAQTAEQKAAAKQAAARELEQLAGQLRQYVEADPVAKSLYDASFRAVEYLKGKINETSRAMYGTDFANQAANYWPMEIADWRGGGELLNDQRAGLKEASIVQKRTGPTGALRVRPFTDVMSRYIDQASDWAAFAEFSDELELLSKSAGEKSAPLSAQIRDAYGKGGEKWLETYVSELNGQGGDSTNSILSKLRSNIAQSSLLLNGGVALKQTPSFFDFGGEIDFDILAKHIPGMFKSAKSFGDNALLQEIDQRSGMLGSRRMGYNNVEMGEATAAARSLGKSFADKLPAWLTNWINKSDYRTVSNGLLACADQVKRDHPEVKANSPEFYDLVTEKFETAVMRSQPIYNRQYRAEYLRSQNEWVRMFSMFRTQQTQNFNQLATAAGEYQAARRTGSETDVRQAKKKLQGIVGGQIAGAVAYSILTGAARALIHKDDDFEDENGNWRADKIAARLGLNFIGSVASTSWLGDTLSAVLIDTITNAATGGKGTSEFYDFEESVSGMIANLGSGIISFAKKPSLKNGKNLVFSISQACGIPTRNIYNMLNTVVMFSLDAAGKNPGGYDDVISMIQSHQGMTDKQRAGESARAAMNYYLHGKDKQADALLSTLDIEAPGVADAIKKAAADSFVAGQMDEERYRDILRTYCGVDSATVERQVEKDRTKSEYNAVMESGRADNAEKYDSLERSLTEKRSAAYTGFYDSSQDRDITADIIRAALPESEADTMVKKYTSAGYQSDYAILRAAGYNPGEAVELHNSIDSDENGSIKQAELWEFFQANPANEGVVSALWDSKGYKKTWEEYKQGKSK